MNVGVEVFLCSVAICNPLLRVGFDLGVIGVSWDPCGAEVVILCVVDGLTDVVPEVLVVAWDKVGIFKHAVEEFDDGLVVDEGPSWSDGSENEVCEGTELCSV